MPVHDELGTRMKENYENSYRFKLTKRTPVIIRIDGRAFHTFTRKFAKPFDRVLMKSMQETMQACCENIEGCVFGYTQSDEISLLLVDYKRFNSNAWFDYNIQKVASISASIATLNFNKLFLKNVDEFIINTVHNEGPDTLSKSNMISQYNKALVKGAMFDSRCFNIPKEEVCNYFYWRQIDAVRNSIEMAGHANFSHKELQHKTCNDIQDMLHEIKGINWNDYSGDCKQGSCCYKTKYTVPTTDKSTGNINGETERSKWIIDTEIPKFNTNRDYIEKWLKAEEE